MRWREKRVLCVVLAGLLVCGYAAFAETRIETDRFQATWDRGALVALTDAAGRGFVETKGTVSATLHLLSGDHAVTETATEQGWGTEHKAVERYASFAGLEGASGACTYTLDPASGGLIVEQTMQSPQAGLWGVGWTIGMVPLDMNLVVPAHSGLKLTSATPGASHSFDYPMSWEAQLLIVEGEGAGFYVWAEDPDGAYKRLTIARSPEGWRIGLVTMPLAPFEDKTACASVRWRLNVYEGDWQVPARRYRDWAEAAFKPTRVEEQQPAWVRDMRCCVIMGLDAEMIEALPKRLDPAQTLIYIPSWRKAGYDRDYPTYDAPVDALAPFLARAHELGFRVMLHVNYFGCHPEHPAYERLKDAHCRSPWGDHDHEWWLWERADPPIKFAYINPASKTWREYFVGAMKELCSSHPVDALHLDQTLCIYNDHNGLIDGMTMIEGNIVLHRELCEALPEVALSGEGLNEVTYRHEAFAQRHVWGVNHADHKFSMPHLRASHPISSYLMRPYTIMYGYLGCAPPTDGQMYAAWAEAYRYYGVIPTLKPDLDTFANSTGFARQFFDETAFWLEHRVDPDFSAPWPSNVTFPYRTHRGTPVTRLHDRSLTSRTRVLSRTIRDRAWVRVPGSVPDWYAYDADRIIGLDPGMWYPLFSEPRDQEVFHIAALPEGHAVETVAIKESFIYIRTRLAAGANPRIAPLIHEATCGSRPAEGEGVEVMGALLAEDGAQFYAEDGVLHAHPPWKTPGSGVVYAQFTLTIPWNALRFVSEVTLDPNAVGECKSDGVTFSARVTRKDKVQGRGVFQDTSEPRRLAVGVSEFQGREVTLELTVDAGRNRNPSYDWARWFDARIECDWAKDCEITLANVQPRRVAVSGEKVLTFAVADNQSTLPVVLPGSIYLFADMPSAVTLPASLVDLSYEALYIDAAGVVLQAPRFASAETAEGTVGGVTKSGFYAHPPRNGRTQMDFPMTLPLDAATLRAFAGIRDGSKSRGVVFRIEANGIELARESLMPGAWKEMTADLAPYRGKPTVISLITDADGDHSGDWAHWGEPVIRARE
ncbi:MAG TPA: DUF6259 domain-containing protein [Candidatus Hydrogenedentes bacterium]|nr:DUF6259 domain-containing protein [Candidatus Hydrogenedentota bacterium]